jgi:hypothetical protein
MTLHAAKTRIALLAAFAALAGGCPAALAQVDTAFTFQGELYTDGQPTSGDVDLQFRLFDAALGGGQVGATLCVDNQAVSDGRFTVLLDFGAAYNGATRFLEIAVRTDAGQSCADASGFTLLTERQPLSATPHASFALAAGTANLLNGQPASFFTNAANLTGTLADARLSTNVSLLSGTQTFTGLKTFTSPPTFASTSPFIILSTTKVNNLNADLLDGLDSSAFALAVHTHDAASIVSGTLADARIPSTIARRNTTNEFTATQAFSTSDLTPIVIRNTNASGLNLTIQPLAAGGRAWSLLASATGNADGAGKFLLRDLNANAVRLAVTDAGNVGIGTAAPIESLHVTGQMHLDSFQHEISYPVGRSFQLGELDTSTLGFNGRFAIASNGNVGIGTGSPFADLHIARNGVNVDVLMKLTGAQYGFNVGVSGSPKMFISRSDGSTFDDYVTIDGPTGFVGVGTTNPIAPLHVNGQLHLLGGSQALSWATGQQLRIGTFDGTTFTQRASFGAAGDFNIFTNTRVEAALIGRQASFNNAGGVASLFVTQVSNSATQGIAWFDRFGSDGPVIDILREGVKAGGISVAGSVVSYNPFTGSHYATADDDFELATLLTMTGDNATFEDRSDAEILYGVRATTTPNDPACLGAFLSRLAPEAPHSSKNPLLVMAVGNGEMLVTAHDGDAPIEPGDLLISSHVPGHAMKLDPARFPVAHVVARAADRVDWSKVPADAAGVRRAKVSVLFTQFTRDASHQELAKENADLRERLERVEAALRELGMLRD